MDDLRTTAVSVAEMDRRGDGDLILSARAGDIWALNYLIEKYRPIVSRQARHYFIIGADRDDLLQEGMIGLFKAIRDFDPNAGVFFGAFAKICVVRQIITAVKQATRRKHAPLNSYISLNGKTDNDDGFDRELLEAISISGADPLETVINNEGIDSLNACNERFFTKLESRVFCQYVTGKSYDEISGQLGCSVKSIDNAMQRVKKKIGIHAEKNFAL